MQTQKDIPVQFLLSPKSVHATIVIGSFGSAQGIIADVFDVDIKQDSNAPAPIVPSTLRYGKKPRIHHIFREETKYPYKIFSIFFVLVIAATLPALLVGVSCSTSPYLQPNSCAQITAADPMLLHSGSVSSARTSAAFPRPWARPRCPTRHSLAQFLRSSSSTSSTTAACPSDTFSSQWLSLAQSPF